jgi:hypothetical protein
MRRYMARIDVGLAFALSLCACESLSKPHPAAKAQSAPLELGKESMSVEINLGSLPIADGLLNNVWPARANPSVQLAWPLT